ncbi:Protein trichome birefringence-like 24 [Striga hermonthica]|uniref:Protein trichome birefringence-like 24 n=1 Tax=Striga hermonthica TaxID=68872 RepID=A0A9N7N1V8_STRHE|nr:Protein trichome birefringence-like 24 [Striga hermonthica]
MVCSWLRSPEKKNKYSVLNLVALILAVVLAFRLIYSNSPYHHISLLSILEVTDQNTTHQESIDPNNDQNNGREQPRNENKNNTNGAESDDPNNDQNKGRERPLNENKNNTNGAESDDPNNDQNKGRERPWNENKNNTNDAESDDTNNDQNKGRKRPRDDNKQKESLDSEGKCNRTESLDSGGKCNRTETELFDSEGKCNLFVGDWFRYEGELLYTNNSCSFIGGHQDCMKNGRPDRDYLHWRWKPHACELARLDPKKFLELMRNKTWAFVGDSITRNHIQSFLCILSTVEKAIEVYHDEEYKSYRWVFPSHNLTVWNLWSPLLAKAAIFEDMNGVSTSEIELHLDVLDDSWTRYYSTFEYMIFSVGSWFPKSTIYYENDLVIGCHNCPKRNLTQIEFKYAYQKVLHNVFDYIVRSNHKEGVVLYRTTTPDHYEGGEWYNGGTCNRTLPVKEGVFEVNGVYRILRDVEMEELGEARVRAKESGVNFGVMDVVPLALMRPDGHPGPYRFFQPFAGGGEEKKVISDCLHWCMPGPIDAWNDVLMEMLVRG